MAQSCLIFLVLIVNFSHFGSSVPVSDQEIRVEEHPVWNKNVSRRVLDYIKYDKDTAILKPKDFKPGCSKGGLIWIFVISAPKNFQARNYIRQSWGNMATFNYSAFTTIHKNMEGKYLKAENTSNSPLRIKVTFMMGVTNDPGLQWKILEENKLYGDILQDNFIESYYNLTIKSLNILKWAALNDCVKNYQYIVKCDDDAYLNVPNLAHILLGGTLPQYNDLYWSYQHENALNGRLSAEQREYLVMGEVRDKVMPHKNPTDKYYVPKYIYADDVYPRYSFGYVYVLSNKIVPCLIKESYNAPLINLEDVYCTGLLTSKCGVKPLNHHLWSLPRLNSICQHRGIIAENLDGAEMLPEILKNVLNSNHSCSVKDLHKQEKKEVTNNLIELNTVEIKKNSTV